MKEKIDDIIVKGMVYIFIIISMIVLFTTVAKMQLPAHGYAGEEVHVYYNSLPVKFTNQLPIIDKGRVFLPVRKMCETFDLDVVWHPETLEIDITDKEQYTTVTMKLGCKTIAVNGYIQHIDSEPFLIDEVTYLPLRVLSDIFCKKIQWFAQSRTIYISDFEASDDMIQEY